MHKALSILTFFLLVSCTTEKKSTPLYKPGVVISFDDDYVQEWHDLDVAMQKYNWKATFCVCYIDSLNPKQIGQLKKLQSKGNEIAGHGYKHKNARNYVSKKGLASYLKNEIIPMEMSFKKNGLILNSFAYPFGANTPGIDKALYKHFKMLRRTHSASKRLKENSCFFVENSKTVTGLGIDNSYQHYDLDYFLRVLNFAKKNNRIVVLYAHKPVQKVTGTYQVDYKTVETICKYVKENNMQFYTLSELHQFLPVNIK
ncbi:MAG: polysaccharide deacetylase family protein [Flavobacterium sp.]